MCYTGMCKYESLSGDCTILVGLLPPPDDAACVECNSQEKMEDNMEKKMARLVCYMGVNGIFKSKWEKYQQDQLKDMEKILQSLSKLTYFQFRDENDTLTYLNPKSIDVVKLEVK